MANLKDGLFLQLRLAFIMSEEESSNSFCVEKVIKSSQQSRSLRYLSNRIKVQLRLSSVGIKRTSQAQTCLLGTWSLFGQATFWQKPTGCLYLQKTVRDSQLPADVRPQTERCVAIREFSSDLLFTKQKQETVSGTLKETFYSVLPLMVTLLNSFFVCNRCLN